MEFESLASQPRVAGLPEVNCRHSTFRGRHNAVLEADPRELNTCTPSTVQVYTCSMPLECFLWFTRIRGACFRSPQLALESILFTFFARFTFHGLLPLWD
jgi:hypothetical protein